MSDRKQQTRREHAFIVDDEAQVRTFVGEALTAAGYIAHQVATSIELEAAMIQWPPSLIILDLSLGNSDAVEILRSLSGSRFRGDVLLITGRDEATLKEVQSIGERRGLSMLPPLMKPFRLEALRERLRAAHHHEPLPSMGVNLEAALKNRWLELW